MYKGHNRGFWSLVLVCFLIFFVNIIPLTAKAVGSLSVDMSDKFEYLIEPFDVNTDDIGELSSNNNLNWKKYNGINDLSAKLGDKPTVWFRAKLPDSITRDTGIYFDELYAQSLDIYIGDDLVYTKSREYIQHYNSLILSLSLTDSSKFIYMRLKSSAPKIGPCNTVTIDIFSKLQNIYLTKGISNIYIGVSLILIGFTTFIISLIGKKQDKKTSLSLSFILTSLGIMLLIVRTNTFMFLSQFEELLFLLYDIALFSLFPSLTYFFKSIVTENEYNFLRKFFKFQLLYSILCILISIINSIFKYKYNYIYSILTIPIVGFLFIIQLIFLISIGLKKIKSKNTNAKIFMLGFGLFSFGIIVDLVLYFLVNISQSFQIWRFGLILFVITLLVLFAKTYAEHKDRADSYELELKNISETARLDYLTKLPNRLALYEMFEKISAQLDSESLPLSIAIIDIDDFKHINDTYGHVAGDFILVELAKLTCEILGPKGELGRWGGEEFLVIFPAMNQSIAHHTSDNLRKQISKHKFEYQNHTINVTLSFGISTFVNGSTLIECVDSADQALYIAKSSGKNCVVSSSKAL